MTPGFKLCFATLPTGLVLQQTSEPTGGVLPYRAMANRGAGRWASWGLALAAGPP